jgi:hypothetical protein
MSAVTAILHYVAPRESNNYKARLLHTPYLFLATFSLILVQFVITHAPGVPLPQGDVLGYADPSEKDVNIANAIGNGWSKKRILREIAKCLPLCSNCHRKLHYRERETKQAPVPVPSRSGKSAGTGEPIIAWPVGTSFV